MNHSMILYSTLQDDYCNYLRSVNSTGTSMTHSLLTGDSGSQSCCMHPALTSLNIDSNRREAHNAAGV